ncbi:predicted protein [Nematostella vectensis]|uniref:G-protein coupled receptors family 1 profile domain-containing protein n=2 Tax=Nematostella vectensis TaxID=45351 RepID=A7TCJ5_NEMVE|nr:predicted protein [Nematostella vectensis]|eukprot:XP_001618327.1 hypothetical protein NEMVEDRAFT_v1g225269 [Nematostella vectensis]
MGFINFTVDYELPSRKISFWILEASISLVVTLLAFGGNLLVCLACSKHQSLRTIPNILVLNLAVTDIVNSCTSLLALTVTLLSGEWLFGATGCYMQAYTAYTCYAATLVTMSATSINRYTMLCAPVRYRKLFTRKKMAIWISVVWIIAFLFGIPPLPWLSWGDYVFDSGYGLCVTDITNSPSLNNMLFSFLAVNIIVIAFCYVNVYKAIRCHRKRVGVSLRVPSLTNSHLRPEDVHTSYTIFIIICLYGFCFLPTFILGIVLFAGYEIPREAKMFSTLSIATGSAANPLVYASRNRRFRRAFCEILKCA